jgi:predicted PurR-regulated permease PerM
VTNKNQLAIVLVTVLLLAGAWLVLAPFLSAISWAVIVAIVTWPFYRKLDVWLGKRPVWPALLMTFSVFLGLFLPLVVVGGLIVRQVSTFLVTFKFQALSAQLDMLMSTSRQLPFIGPQIQAWLQSLEPQLETGLRGQIGRILSFLANIGQGIGQSLITFGLTLFILFFLYLYGKLLAAQIEQALYRFGGESLTSLLDPITNTVRAVASGLLLTAIAQGFLAGLGFWAVGISGEVVWGLVTVLLAIIQIPTFLVWLPWSLWLIFTGQLWQGLALLAWGALAVSTIDNVLKPIFISQGSGIPFLLAFFGVLGGLLAFGTVGIILGPVILSILLTLWQRWLGPEKTEEPTSLSV